MPVCPFDFVNDGKKHTICLVGGGGKTTVMYELAAAWGSLRTQGAGVDEYAYPAACRWQLCCGRSSST